MYETPKCKHCVWSSKENRSWLALSWLLRSCNPAEKRWQMTSLSDNMRKPLGGWNRWGWGKHPLQLEFPLPPHSFHLHKENGQDRRALKQLEGYCNCLGMNVYSGGWSNRERRKEEMNWGKGSWRMVEQNLGIWMLSLRKKCLDLDINIDLDIEY